MITRIFLLTHQQLYPGLFAKCFCFLISNGRLGIVFLSKWLLCNYMLESKWGSFTHLHCPLFWAQVCKPKCDGLSLPFSHFISLSSDLLPLPHFPWSNFFSFILSPVLSYFLSSPSTTETWRWAYHFLHHRTKLSCWLWISHCVRAEKKK